MPHATSPAPPRVVLDWRKGPISPVPQPCVICGQPTVGRSPARDVPCHKGCAEAWITAHARDARHLAQLIRRYTPGKGAA